MLNTVAPSCGQSRVLRNALTADRGEKFAEKQVWDKQKEDNVQRSVSHHVRRPTNYPLNCFQKGALGNKNKSGTVLAQSCERSFLSWCSILEILLRIISSTVEDANSERNERKKRWSGQKKKKKNTHAKLYLFLEFWEDSTREIGLPNIQAFLVLNCVIVSVALVSFCLAWWFRFDISRWLDSVNRHHYHGTKKMFQ